MDLAKAFNTVNHNILLAKLVKMGVFGKVLTWCKSYLELREQKTIVNGKLSGLNVVPCGVPQGSILGPLFFLIYINDLVYSIKSASIQMYADDTVLYVTGEDSRTATVQLQADLDRLVKWCRANKLSLNAKKTKQMVFGTRYQIKKFRGDKLHVDGKAIQRVPSFKYLGLILDPTLSFNLQIANVKNIVSHKMFMLSKIRRYLDNDCMLCIYRSMVLPYLDYGDVAIANASPFLLGKLQSLQDKCLKICLNIRGKYDSNHVHNLTHIAKLGDRRRTHINNFMYHRSHSNNNNNVEIPEGRVTRSKAAANFEVSKPNNEAYKRSVSYFGAVQWNSLPPKTRNAVSFFTFKSKQQHDLKRIRY